MKKFRPVLIQKRNVVQPVRQKIHWENYFLDSSEFKFCKCKLLGSRVCEMHFLIIQVITSFKFKVALVVYTTCHVFTTMSDSSLMQDEWTT